MGGRRKADPEAWRIVVGKLFLNDSTDGLKRGTADPAGVVID
jgi:hypothetical protein